MTQPEAGHVAFVLPHFHGGGAERLTLELIGSFLARGAKVDLVLMQARGEFLELLPPQVAVIDLGTPRIRAVPRALRAYLRRARPDALLAAMWPLTSAALLARIGLGQSPRVAVADHCPLLEQYRGSRRTLAALRLSVAATYRLADAIVGVSRGLAAELARLARVRPERVATILNPVGPPARSGADPDALWRGLPGKRILAVGRIKPVKNFPLLLRAFARLAGEREAVLAVVGDGVEQSGLAALATQLGVADRVLLAGYTATPGDWFAGADVLALTSDYEGLGNVLIEALHCGLPIVATDCPYGPAEVLEGGRWGRLVPPGDETALAATLSAALDEPVDAAALKARAAQFSVSTAADGYWRLLFPQ